MSNINQLLSKAMSTTSEEEAMSCLRMARKKGGRLEDSGNADYNGHDAKYWYDKAAAYYAKAKATTDGLTPAQQQQLWTMYKTAENRSVDLSSENRKLRKDLHEAQNKKPVLRPWVFPVFTVQFIAIIVLVQMIH